MFVLLLYGFAGGVVLDLLELRAVLKSKQPIVDSRQGAFRATLAAILGGVLGMFAVLVYNVSGSALSPVAAVHLGASAPVLMKALADNIPTIPEGPKKMAPGGAPEGTTPSAFELVRRHFSITKSSSSAVAPAAE